MATEILTPQILTPQPAYPMGPERSAVIPTPRLPHYDLGESYDDFAGVWPYGEDGSFEKGVRHSLAIAGGLWLGIMTISWTARMLNR